MPSAPTQPGLRGRLAGAVACLFPGYFALVMATGIVSIAADALVRPVLGDVLLALNVGFYAVLVALFAARLVLFPRRLLGDLQDHARGAGFFTVVAGTCVLGSQAFLVASARPVAHALWVAGIVLWCVVMYAFFTATTVRERKPALEAGINGAWLLATVATQSVAVLGTLLAPGFGAARAPALLFALCMHLLGAMLYLSIITLILYRFTFLELSTERLQPPYWISMGAVAITTLAGANLLLHADLWPLLAELRPFLIGSTLFFWATATWWIPLLLALGAWRHGVRRYPFRYDPQYWGLVFPLGMYAVATLRLARALDLPFLLPIPQVFAWLALAAWTLTFLGLTRATLRVFKARGQDQSAN